MECRGFNPDKTFKSSSMTAFKHVTVLSPVEEAFFEVGKRGLFNIRVPARWFLADGSWRRRRFTNSRWNWGYEGPRSV